MATDQTDKDIADVGRRAEELMEEDPIRFPTEEEVEKGVPELDRIELGKDAKTWEVLEALGTTRSEVGIALQSVWSVLEDLKAEIDRLQRHRHDTTKAYSGRPEL